MKRCIVMAEWARDNGPSYRSRDEFLWHHMLLSLLYDEVWAQDETLLLSRDMAKWFGNAEGIGLLEETVECGGLAVLRRPRNRFPPELRESSERHPIATRRKHLENYSTDNDGTPIQFGRDLLQFHSRLEDLLMRHADAHRPAGALKKAGVPLMEAFATRLVQVLTDKGYERWLRAKFKAIEPAVAEDFARYAIKPELAINRLKQTRSLGDNPKLTRLEGKLEFSTALAVQVASSYPNKVAKALQHLTETVFARLFCEEEQADGRYGERLRELPSIADLAEIESQRIHEVRTEITTFYLPTPQPGFSKIINEVRSMDSGKTLRKAMSQLGSDPKFQHAKRAWADVAHDLATKMDKAKMKKLDMQILESTYSRGTACSFIGGLAAVGARHSGGDFPWEPVWDVVLGGAAGIAVDAAISFTQRARGEDDHQNFAYALKNAVNYRNVSRS